MNKTPNAERKRVRELEEEYAFCSETSGSIHLRSPKAQAAWSEYQRLVQSVGPAPQPTRLDQQVR